MPTRAHWLIPDSPYASYDDYLAQTGGSALERAAAMSADACIAEVGRAGLRGRGGAGFPTAVKWRSVASHPCPTRYAVCNAAEGEPGTFKDRYLLRRDPYSTLEGLVVAARVVGAEKAYVAIKASFTLEIARLRAAIAEMSAAGAFGALEVEVVEGPEEYLFGEEKALLEVVEGNDPLPREPHYPPYEWGLFATQVSPNPAVVNNVETLARVAGILRWGAESFRRLGTEDTAGPILFTISGDVQRPGVYELEPGLSLEALFNDVAGGPRPGRRFKAALSGVSTGVIPAEKFKTRADHACLQLIGAGLGSAGFVVIDDETSMPRVAQAVARFLYVESCNQCPACKHGLRTSSGALDELFDPAKATSDDVPRAEFGARHAPQGNRCYLPVQGSVLIPSLVRAYADEFQAQLARPRGGGPMWPIPKMVDFDESKRAFVYDEAQLRKRPDWTYDPAFPTPPPPARAAPRDTAPTSHASVLLTRTARPAEPTGAIRTESVRLMPDVRTALARVVDDERDVDEVVNRALREWLQERGA